MLVSVGDFGIWPARGGTVFLDRVDEAAAQAGVDVLVVPGNHDDYDQLAAAARDDHGWMVLRPHVRAAPRGHTWQVGGHTWMAVGGAASIDGPGGAWPQARGPIRAGEHRLAWDQLGTPVRRRVRADADLGGWWPQEIVTDDDVAAALAAVEQLEGAGGRVSVLVTHDAPAEVELPGTPFPLGDEVRERLQRVTAAARPHLHLCGHWHRHLTAELSHGGQLVMLAADVTPREPAAAVVDCPPDGPPTVRILPPL